MVSCGGGGRVKSGAAAIEPLDLLQITERSLDNVSPFALRSRHATPPLREKLSIPGAEPRRGAGDLRCFSIADDLAETFFQKVEGRGGDPSNPFPVQQSLW